MEARVAVGVAVGSTAGALVGVAVRLGVAVDRMGVSVGKAVGVGVGVATDTNWQPAIKSTRPKSETVAATTFSLLPVTIVFVPSIRCSSVASSLIPVNQPAIHYALSLQMLAHENRGFRHLLCFPTLLRGV